MANLEYAKRFDRIDVHNLIPYLNSGQKYEPYERLRMYDQIKGSNLIDTLVAYVETGFNVTETSNVLIAALNTIKYRLERIGDISGLNARVAQDALTLYISHKMTQGPDKKEPEPVYNAFGVKI